MVPRLFGAEHLLGETQALGVDLIGVLPGIGFGVRLGLGVGLGLGLYFSVGFGLGLNLRLGLNLGLSLGGLGFFAFSRFHIGLGRLAFGHDLILGGFTFERFGLALRLFAFGLSFLALEALFFLVLLILVHIFVDAVLGLQAL